MTRTRRLAAAVGLALVLGAGLAHAEPTAADKETARRLMQEGRGKRDANDLQGALKSFQAADAIMQVPTTGLEVARTEIALGQLVEARDKLLTIVRSPQVAGEPKPFLEARAAAKQLGADIEPRIPTLTITLRNVPSGATPEVAVDGVAIPAAALQEPRAVNPGYHLVTAAAGGANGRAEVSVPERGTKEVVLELPAPSPAGAEPSTAPPPAQPEPPPKPAGSRGHTLAYVGFGIGVAGIVAGSITGYLALSSFNSAKSNGCIDNRCPPSTYGDLDNASTMATVSTIAFAVGGAGVVAGVIGLFVGKPSGEAKAAAHAGATFHPWVGPASAGLAGSF